MKISIKTLAKLNVTSIAAAIEQLAGEHDSIASGVIGSSFSCSGPGSGWQRNHDVTDYARRALDGDYGAGSYIDSADGREATMDESGEVVWSDESVVEIILPTVEQARECPAEYRILIDSAADYGADEDEIQTLREKVAAPSDETKIAEAAEHIDASPAADDDGYIYFARETGNYYRVDESELVELYDFLHSRDEETRGMAYSLWCAQTCNEEFTPAEAEAAGLIEE